MQLWTNILSNFTTFLQLGVKIAGYIHYSYRQKQTIACFMYLWLQTISLSDIVKNQA